MRRTLPLSNLCVVMGDELWFYYGGFAGTSPDGKRRCMYGWGSMGLAKLRRDGFASLLKWARTHKSDGYMCGCRFPT